MWFLILFVYIGFTQQVILQQATYSGQNRVILKGGKDPCEGHIKIYHKNKWGYAGDTGWSKSTEEVVCRSTHCGKPVEGSTEDILMNEDVPVWLNEMVCNGNESHLWDCSPPGWGISVYRKDTVKKITCSDRIKMSLDGFQCAGAVQFSTDGGTRLGYLCADNWGKKEADRLCESLNCGKHKEIPQQNWMDWKGFKEPNSKKMTIKCSDIESEIDNLWQCVTQESPTCQRPASVICQGYERIQLSGDPSNVCSGWLEKEENDKWERKNIKTSPDVRCQQMHCGMQKNTSTQGNNETHLTCTDTVKVLLMDGNLESNCYGTVHIKRNDSNYPVCASNWSEKEGNVVCKELKCGKVISTEKKSGPASGIMDNVKCSGSESSLWHCMANRGNTAKCSTAYVICEKSISVRLKDGPGKCAGRVEIQYEGRWKQVNKEEWKDENSKSVCREVKCGDSSNTKRDEKFIQGSGDFLSKKVNCKTGTSHIADCIGENSATPSMEKKEAVGITCEEHMLVFLEGTTSCSGMVGIEHGNKTYWLSGSNETWNNETANLVCQQKHCGNVVSFNVTRAKESQDVTSLNCSSTSKSLFDCERDTVPSGYNNTIATVTCSGNITIKLSNRCWGDVIVCADGKCGGVCANAWTDSQSKMLCKDLKCGDKILSPSNRLQSVEVIFKSLHATSHTTKLSQCNFVPNNESHTCERNSAKVVCSGSVKPRFPISRDKCSGNVEVSYEGKWLPVCQSALNNNQAKRIICNELNCGDDVSKIKTTNYFGPKPAEGAISQIQCGENDSKLRACYITSSKDACPLAALQCSNWTKVKLSDTCSGAVFVHTDNDKNTVSSENWGQSEGNRLCKDLECGESSKVYNSSQSMSLWNSTFKCENNPGNIWACEKNILPTQKERLSIECKDKPSVTLSDTCNGMVMMNGISVCSTNWNDEYSHLVCQEQMCSNAIYGSISFKEPKPNAEYWHVMCEDYHDKLGQCKRYKAKCDKKLVAISCVKNVKFNTARKCGGQIKVNYQDNKWEYICPMKFSPELMKKLCHHFGCGDYNVSIPAEETNKVTLRTSLECTEDHMDIRHCVSTKPCGEVKPAEIYCNGYVPPPPKPPVTPGPPIIPIILGLGVALILVILIVIFVRIYMIKKARNAAKFPATMLSQNEMEFESGEFEDLKANEMDDFSRGRFRSDAEFVTENDAQSASSVPYDDIDEVTESQPLTSQATTAVASGGDFIHEDRNGVTYEVDDPQENYDDIDASPDFTQTKAEVHDSHQPPPESYPVAPQKLVQEDDYLVPGQDG
uniref:SRCR domain-containing protein n=1 Tax=Anabas testudineus TaxID=64144 RepID=A0A3Q1HC17_ANATE